MKHFLVGITVGIALVTSMSYVQAQEKKGVKVGTLTCHEASGWGLVFSSSHSLRCVFSGSEKGAKPVHFTGEIKKYGVDIGYQANAIILWAVASTSDKFTPGDIAGKYAGATADVAWAAGLGANILVGGSKSGIALQPVSVEGLNGANLAAGLAEVELKAAK
jgi:hypothetical protein